MDLASGQIRQVTDGRSNNTEPTWFPDSQNLAFTSDQAGRPQVYKVNITAVRHNVLPGKVRRTRMRMSAATVNLW